MEKYRRLSQKAYQVHNCLWTLLRYILVPAVPVLFCMVLLGILFPVALGNQPSYDLALTVLPLLLGIATCLIGALISVTLIIHLTFQMLAKTYTWQRRIMLILLYVFYGILCVMGVSGAIACAKFLIAKL